MSLLDPLCCGFAKVAVIKMTLRFGFGDNRMKRENKAKSECYKDNYSVLKTMFPHCSFEDYQLNKFIKNCLKLRILHGNILKLDWEKKLIMVTFDPFNFSKLENKKEHTLFNCNGCLKYFKKSLSHFPINKSSAHYLKKAKEAGLFEEGVEDVAIVDDDKDEDVSQNARRKILKGAKESIEEQWKETTVIRFQKLF